MSIPHISGNPIDYDTERDLWYYIDNNQPCEEPFNRPCTFCKEPPTKEGYDHCIGYIPEAVAACCGHGIDEGYMKDKDGNITVFYPI